MSAVLNDIGRRIGTVYNDTTDAERSADVTVVDASLFERNVHRYGENESPGNTDMTAAIQAAIDVASQTTDVEVGRKVYFPGGLYKITAPLTIEANGVELIADGVVRIAGNDIDDDYMLIVGGNAGNPIYHNAVRGHFIWWRNQAAAAATQGCIRWSHSSYGKISGSRFYNGYAPLLMHDVSGCKVEDLGFYETIAGGIGSGSYLARFHTCAFTVISQAWINANYGTKANNKVIIDFNCDDIKIHDTDVGQLLFTRSGGGGTFAPRWVRVYGAYAESNQELAGYDLDNCKDVRLIGVTANAGLVGVRVGSGALGCGVYGGTFLDNEQDGVLVEGGSELEFESMDISSNNAAGGASYSAFRINGDCDHVALRKSRLKNHMASGNTHAYGVLVTGGHTVSDLTIEDNDIANYATAAILDNAGATNKIVRRNKGYVTENSGTSSIASGSTNVDVTHGLSITPDATKIVVNFTEQGTNDYGRVWISNITSTQFRVNVSADPGASNLDFSWRVVS